jgi:hypothetical protein
LRAYDRQQRRPCARCVSSVEHASGLTTPLGPLGMAKIERKADSWQNRSHGPRRFIDPLCPLCPLVDIRHRFIGVLF